MGRKYANISRSGKTGNRGWNLRNAMVIVANIPKWVGEEAFLRMFPQIVDVCDFRFLTDDPSSDSKTAIIQFDSTANAVDAIDIINGKIIDGNELVVFSVKELRDYVRIPESTFLIASRDKTFSNQTIFSTFSHVAHIDHFFANSRRSSCPMTGVAVFKDSNEFLKAENHIRGWHKFEVEGMMAIKVPSLDDFYADERTKANSSPTSSSSSSEGKSSSFVNCTLDSSSTSESEEEMIEKKERNNSCSVSWVSSAFFVPSKLIHTPVVPVVFSCCDDPLLLGKGFDDLFPEIDASFKISEVSGNDDLLSSVYRSIDV
jgi:hypothetical protein